MDASDGDATVAGDTVEADAVADATETEDVGGRVRYRLAAPRNFR